MPERDLLAWAADEGAGRVRHDTVSGGQPLSRRAPASRFSGINSFRVLMRTYWMAGVAAGIAGVVFLARTNSNA